MGKKYLFAEDPQTGRAKEVPVDPKHLDRQVRDLNAAGYETTVMDSDERIRMGQLTQDLLRNTR